ncbi:MAG: PAS domain-containing sensor histidine kinase [Candidatus Omnitrophica bacterium]|nr:Sensor histidine kinase RcsC [bacterium]NUN97327.1 PAS domain-containing sensor histidine kinase [Candidatus Omnitrophota bacterium]
MEINQVHLFNHQIVRDVPFGVIVVDRDRNIMDWNVWLERVTGVPRHQVQGRPLSQSIPDRYDAELTQAIDEIFETGRAGISLSEEASQFLNFVTSPARSEPMEMILETQVKPLFNLEGDVASVYVVIEDVTERVRRLNELERLNRDFEIVNAALEEANRVKTDFLSNTSHELRTPLTSILGFVEMLENDLATSREEEKEFIANIRQSATQLLDLVNNILQAAAIQAGRIQLDIHPIALAELLAEVHAVTHPLARQRKLDLQLDMRDLSLEVLADYRELKQVLANVLDNSIKFSDEGTIRMDAYPAPRRSGFITIEVTDTGIGIPADRLHLAFEPFRQGDSSTVRRHGGTGLGLSVSRTMVERMKGEMELRSAGPGKGTTVYIILPEAPVEASA